LWKTGGKAGFQLKTPGELISQWNFVALQFIKISSNFIFSMVGTANLKDKRLQNMMLAILKCLHFLIIQDI